MEAAVAGGCAGGVVSQRWRRFQPGRGPGDARQQDGSSAIPTFTIRVKSSGIRRGTREARLVAGRPRARPVVVDCVAGKKVLKDVSRN